MDSERFDGLVRSFGQIRSRRQTLRGLAGVAAAGALALGGPAASANDCKRNGKPCKKNRQCCSDNCSSGTCQAAATCAPAYSCNPELPVFCGEAGQCAQVQDVEGGCACIEGVCAAACTLGSECASGLCVSVPGCCPQAGDTFCGTPCSAGTATSSRATSGHFQP
jgi:hypothetical protein